MATTSDYLEQLQTDKSNLIAKYNEKGLQIESSATFTDLVEEFDNLPSGSDLTTEEYARIYDLEYQFDRGKLVVNENNYTEDEIAKIDNLLNKLGGK